MVWDIEKSTNRSFFFFRYGAKDIKRHDGVEAKLTIMIKNSVRKNEDGYILEEVT